MTNSINIPTKKTSEAKAQADKKWRINNRDKYNAYIRKWRNRNQDRWREILHRSQVKAKLKRRMETDAKAY